MTQAPYAFSPELQSMDERFGFYRQFGSRALELTGIRPGMRVLEVGCGAGAFTRLLAGALAPGGEVVGVDRDPKLLDAARAHTRAPDGVRVRFEESDALTLPFTDGEFDAVVSMFLLCILPSPLDALVEMRRVARPGATIASASCFCKSGIFPIFDGIHEFEGNDRIGVLRRRFMDAYRTRIRNPTLGLPDGRDLDVWGDYARAGLVDLRIDGVLTVMTPGDARWSDEEGVAFVEQRRRIETGLLDRLSEADFARLADGGVTASDVEELRRLLAEKYEWLLADKARVRRGMEILSEPAVIIRGRVP